MADLDPHDIKDPDEDEEVPRHDPHHEPVPKPEPDLDEIADEDEEPGKEPDLAATCEHLVRAVAELARASGSPPAVTAALEQARIALRK